MHLTESTVRSVIVGVLAAAFAAVAQYVALALSGSGAAYVVPATVSFLAAGWIFSCRRDVVQTAPVDERAHGGRAEFERALILVRAGSWCFDATRNQFVGSTESHKIYGTPEGASIKAEEFFARVHPDDRAYVEAAWQGALAGKDYEVEHRINLNGGVRWVRQRAEFEFDENGEVRGGFGVVQDITDRKAAEGALRASDNFLRRVIDTTPSMVFVKDWDGRFVLGNEALARCYGTTSQGIVGKTDADYNPNVEELKHFSEDDRAVMLSRTEKHIPEEQVTDCFGETRWFSTVKVPLLNDDGSCNKVLGVATDITERRRAELALKEADRKKDEFIAMLAHELRNPMAAISSAASVLSLPDLPPDEIDYAVGVVKQRISQLARLVDDLLDVSRIIRGKIELHLEDIDLSSVIEHALDATNALFQEKQQTLTVEVAKPLWVYGDAVRLEEVVHNLLTNASRYTPECGHIRVSAMQDARRAEVRVRDNGIGMSAELIPRIFDMFGQGEDSYRRSTAGLGVGLTIVKRLVEMHGGFVSVHSEGLGKGSEFRVVVPLARGAQLPRMREVPVTVAAPLHILVAEDHKDTAKMTAVLLQHQGHVVDIAFDGPSAMKQAIEKRPDVVLLDLGLPGMDGFEVAENLRRSGLTETMIVAVSGYGQERDLARCRESGIDKHLLKPIDYKELTRIVATPRQENAWEREGRRAVQARRRH